MIFLETSFFTRQINKYLSDKEYTAFRNELAINPIAGDVVQGVNGLRKVCYRVQSRRRREYRSGIYIYYYYTNDDRIYLLTVYYKDETTILTFDDKHFLQRLLEVWKIENF